MRTSLFALLLLAVIGTPIVSVYGEDPKPRIIRPNTEVQDHIFEFCYRFSNSYDCLLDLDRLGYKDLEIRRKPYAASAGGFGINVPAPDYWKEKAKAQEERANKLEELLRDVNKEMAPKAPLKKSSSCSRCGRNYANYDYYQDEGVLTRYGRLY